MSVFTKMKHKNKSKYLQGYLMISPQIIGFFVFTLYPLVWAISKAFYYYDGSLLGLRYVGIENFTRLFASDSTYWHTWITTIKFSILKMPIELTLAMLLAIILSKKIKGKGFFRAVFYLPNIISVAIVGLIITSMFDYFGFINAWLMRFGIISEEIDWFSSEHTAMFALVSGSIWCTFGINTLYFITALANVPNEVYESAKIDGASPMKTFFKITIPLTMPVVGTIVLLSLNGTLHTSDYILVTTNGAPAGKTFTVMPYIVSKFVPGFANGAVNIGYGCAMSVVTSIIMILIALIYTRINKKLQGTD